MNINSLNNDDLFEIRRSSICDKLTQQQPTIKFKASIDEDYSETRNECHKPAPGTLLLMTNPSPSTSSSSSTSTSTSTCSSSSSKSTANSNSDKQQQSFLQEQHLEQLEHPSITTKAHHEQELNLPLFISEHEQKLLKQQEQDLLELEKNINNELNKLNNQINNGNLMKQTPPILVTNVHPLPMTTITPTGDTNDADMFATSHELPSSSSSSSVVAALSVLSFSTSSTNSTSSLSSSASSYGDVTMADVHLNCTQTTRMSCYQMNDSSTSTTLANMFDELKNHSAIATSPNVSSSSSPHSSAKSQQEEKNFSFRIASTPNKLKYCTSVQASELEAPYKGKSFISKEWLIKILYDYITSDTSSSSANTGICSNDELACLVTSPSLPLPSLIATSISSNSSCMSTSHLSTSACKINRKNQCLLLIGECGTGKTHLCCEIKWPTVASCQTSWQREQNGFSSNEMMHSINQRILNVYFMSLFNSKQNGLKRFYMHLSSTLQEFFAENRTSFNISDNNSPATKVEASAATPFKSHIKLKLNEFAAGDDISDEKTNDHFSLLDYVERLADKFIQNILNPLKMYKFESSKNSDVNNMSTCYYYVIDGIDEAIMQHELFIKPFVSMSESTKVKLPPKQNEMNFYDELKRHTNIAQLSSAEMILAFINKTISSFPNWLNIIITCKRASEKKFVRKWLTNAKYDKLVVDKCISTSALSVAASSSSVLAKSQSPSRRATLLTPSIKIRAINESKEILNTNDENEQEDTSKMNETTSSIQSKMTQHQSALLSNVSMQSSRSSHSISTNIQMNSSTTVMNLSTGECDSTKKAHNRLSQPIELSNLASIANLRDVQTYILKRINDEKCLKQKLNGGGDTVHRLNAIDNLNLLLIKANYSIMYVEKIFEMITSGLISSSDIANIPVTINGLYLYLIEKLLTDYSNRTNRDSASGQNQSEISNGKPLIYAMFGLCLLEMRPFTIEDMYKKLSTRFANLSFSVYKNLFDYVAPLLFRRVKATDYFCFFHSSLVEWFSDVKFCTQKYLLDLSEAHFTLCCVHLACLKATGSYRANINDQHKSKNNKPTEKNLTRLNSIWSKFKYHLINALICSSQELMTNSELEYFYLLCEGEYELQLVSTLDRKFLLCKKLLKSVTDSVQFESTKETNELSDLFRSFALGKLGRDELISSSSSILFDLVIKKDLLTLKLAVNVCKRNENTVNWPWLKRTLSASVDAYNQTILLVAVKLNSVELVSYLLETFDLDLNHCDNSGWTALRYSSWIGLLMILLIKPVNDNFY
jgi:hypothetical protein